MRLPRTRVLFLTLLPLFCTASWSQPIDPGVELVRQAVWSEYLIKKCPKQFRFRSEYASSRAKALEMAKLIFETENLRPVIQKIGGELMVGGCENVANFIRRQPERYEYIYQAVLK